MADPVPLTDILRDEIKTFLDLVEPAVLDPSPRVRALFQNHVRDRYPCVERLFAERGTICAAIRNQGVLYRIPVAPIPGTYLGERRVPIDVDLAALWQ